ncbi:MAG: hypothetical protein M1837_006674 [Sclerophora amabilis]|nr:MAG: hypothetical protein M1837_006674 [Sclerophora amabilis]
MEEPVRGFKEISVDVTGVQSSQDRTGLSKYYNLYFVGYVDAVHVYQPQFPNQALSNRPDLIIALPVSRPGLEGYIDERSPHGINNLVVDDLGDEEILACVCDDGDVVAFYTRGILNAIQRQSELDVPSEADVNNVRAFFVENVGKSAWGLAIHKAHRMIAVSSNTTKITVFVFGLAEQDSNSDADPSDGTGFPSFTTSRARQSVPRKTSKYPQTHRSSNVRIILDGHGKNIPSIGFYNGETPSEETWLVSTDIEGWMMVWNVGLQKLIRKVCLSSRNPNGLGVRQAWDVIPDQRFGWGVLCLDVRNFRVTNGVDQTFGCSKPSKPPSQDPRHSADPWNITASISDVQDSSRFHPDFNNFHAVPQHVPFMDIDDNESNESYDESEFSEHEDMDVDEDQDEGIDLNHPPDMLQAPNDITQNPEFIEPYEVMTQPPAVAGNDANAMLNVFDFNNYVDGGVGNAAFGLQSQHTSSHNNYPGSASTSIETRKHETSSAFKLASSPATLQSTSAPQFAVMQTSERNVQLFPNPLSYPSTICEGPLVQRLAPNSMMLLGQFERLNMAQQIPELGLVIVASQTGRAAIMRLTRMSGRRPQLAFRLEWLLPFRSQEDEGLRPSQPLLGFAIAPIQGMEMASDADDLEGTSSRSNRRQTWRRVETNRRYRLMMMYYDSTVLSYEIGRSQKASIGGESTGPLVL